MRKACFTLAFTMLLRFAASGQITSGNGGAMPLSAAVADFNRGALSDRIGATQLPVTLAEVVAAIRLWERPADAPISDALLARFKAIAETQILPGNAVFESLNGYDRAGSHIFDVWSVRIRIDRPDGSSYAFVIRHRTVDCRTLDEELRRLDKLIEDRNVASWPGGYRILERRRDLAARISQNTQGRPPTHVALPGRRE